MMVTRLVPTPPPVEVNISLTQEEASMLLGVLDAAQARLYLTDKIFHFVMALRSALNVK